MYKEIKRVKVGTRMGINNHGLFLFLKNDKQREIVRIDADGNECDKYDFIDLSKLYRFHFMRDHLIISFENGTTSFYTYDKKKVYELNKQLHFIFVKEDDSYIYMDDDIYIYRFDKRNYTVDWFPIANKNLLLFLVFDNNLVFKFEGNQLFLYKNTPSNIPFSWQLDLRSIYPNQKEFRIYDIKEYQGSIIAATTGGIVRLSAKDGSIIWKTCRYAATIEIVENIGYICSGLALYKINLDTGKESGYGWEYEGLPDFTYNGKVYWASGRRVVYHDGLLWYSVYSSGDSFLIAINPENGNYEWIHHVDTYEKTGDPQFYGDRMFLSDTGNMLHIYEKVK